MKECIGIDVSKKELQVALVAGKDSRVKVTASRKFQNNEAGFKELLNWSSVKVCDPDCLYVMEATGTYHENLTDFLYAHSVPVCVELPNKIMHFGKSLNLKTKTDKVDATLIAKYGLERRPSLWRPMTENFSEMRSVSRLLMSLKKDRARYKNRLSALSSTSRSPEAVLTKVSELIDQMDSMVKELEDKLLELAGQTPEFMERVGKIAKVKGVRELTIIAVLCETNGFRMMRNVRQVVSYAGLDVVGYESGTISRPGRISKKGNPRLRHLLYQPGMVAGHFGPPSIVNLYNRVVERNPKHKKKAIVAAERKLLILIYTLWKNNSEYNPEHESKKVDFQNGKKEEGIRYCGDGTSFDKKNRDVSPCAR